MHQFPTFIAWWTNYPRYVLLGGFILIVMVSGVTFLLYNRSDLSHTVIIEEHTFQQEKSLTDMTDEEKIVLLQKLQNSGQLTLTSEQQFEMLDKLAPQKNDPTIIDVEQIQKLEEMAQ